MYLKAPGTSRCIDVPLFRVQNMLSFSLMWYVLGQAEFYISISRTDSFAYVS